ncbi:hypothetical protein EJB05_08602, partial [Eragrostis curvula]
MGMMEQMGGILKVMGLSSAVLWWEDWQLRILVLGSLFMQYFLAFAAPQRKRSIKSYLRFCIWLAYLGSDALAIYALATLFNRQKKQDGTADGSQALEVMWAPILLIHLAGQDAITAYNIEDNELWRRHIVTAISQVTVAIYVFCKSWSGEDRLLKTAILLFIAGVLKCIQKPIAFRNASIYRIESSLHREDRNATVDDLDKKVSSLKAYIKAAKKCYNMPSDDGNDKSSSVSLYEDRRLDQPLRPYRLFIDHAYAYCHRLSTLRSFLALPSGDAERVIQIGLGNTFTRLYTRENRSVLVLPKKNRSVFNGKVAKSMYSIFIRELALCLTFSAIGLFHKGRKEGYNDNDIKVTYTLICCTAALEFFTFNYGSIQRYDEWGGRVAQYNLMSFFVREKQPSELLKLAHFLRCKEFLDRQCYVDECNSYFPMKEQVIKQVKAGWEECIKDTQTYWIFNDRRGQFTILQEKCDKELFRTLELEAPFDESILLWHIATDICFHAVDHAADDEADISCASTISDYMFYLLAVKPDMLMTGTRESILTDARMGIRSLLRDEDSADSEGGLTRKILRILRLLRDNDSPASKGGLIRKILGIVSLLRAGMVSLLRASRPLRPLRDDDSPASKEDLTREIHSKAREFKGEATPAQALILRASKLASQLLKLDSDKRWKVMRGVWVEMLCFSASRCKGYLHAKSLGNGGEFLTYVWLLLSHMGMESMAERSQRSGLGQLGDREEDDPMSSHDREEEDDPMSSHDREEEVTEVLVDSITDAVASAEEIFTAIVID